MDTAFHADHPEYDSPDDPKELADLVPSSVLKILVAEAVEAYRTDENWPERRKRFLMKLDLFEHVWFGGM